MTELPSKNQCKTENLLEYRFEGMTFHSINYDPQWEVLSVGTSTGKLLNYAIKVDSETCYLEDAPSKKPKLPVIVNDSQINNKPD